MFEDKIAGVGQYLTFHLSEDVYAIEITRVREVLDLKKVTKLPNTPGYMEGVINLRGGVVPVIDLRLKFNMDATEKTVNTCIIIMEVNVNKKNTHIGALADSVKEVIEIDVEHIAPVPKVGINLDGDFIKGIGKRNDDFIIILDINRVFSDAESLMLQAVGEHVAME